MEATFSFIDLAGFTALTEAHGDESAADLVLRFGELVRGTLDDNSRLVKSIGDAVLVTFPRPEAALVSLTRLWTRTKEEPAFLALRAGVHHGEATERGDDVFGAAVNLAARVTAQAVGGQILGTRAVAEVGKKLGITVRSLGKVTLRNLREPVELFELACAPNEDAAVIDPVCRMRVAPDAAAGQLRFGEREFYFCSLQCVAAFADAPMRYTDR
ncbi:MAG: adenylate/guanylate cyclase domain-containing protein [Candidatus Binatia bacterium]